jgi:hypothetical protein
MDFGAHLPLMDFGGHPYTLRHLVDDTKRAAGIGFGALAVNDHMVFSVPWPDGPGSSPQDYDADGVAFSERWARLDEAIEVLRGLWRTDSEPFVGRFYSTEGMSLELFWETVQSCGFCTRIT